MPEVRDVPAEGSDGESVEPLQSEVRASMDVRSPVICAASPSGMRFCQNTPQHTN